jgi:hypothetical protein
MALELFARRETQPAVLTVSCNPPVNIVATAPRVEEGDVEVNRKLEE